MRSPIFCPARHPGHGNREISVDIKIMDAVPLPVPDRILSISLCYELGPWAEIMRSAIDGAGATSEARRGAASLH